MNTTTHTTGTVRLARLLSMATIIAIMIMTTGTAAFAAEATATTVTLTWTAPGDDGDAGTASYYDIRYATAPVTAANWDEATQVSGEPTPQPAGSSEEFTITGLTPATTYYFALKVGDEVPNWSTISNVVAQTTAQEEIPPADISDFLADNPTPNTVNLSWTAPGDDGTTGTAAEYDVRYSTSMINGANWDAATQVDGEPAPQAAGNSESLTVAGLSPSTTYYFAIRTGDDAANWSGLSNVTSVSTSVEQDAPGAIADVSIDNATENSLRLNWTAPGDDGYTGTAAAYDIRYSTSTITDANWDAATQVTGESAPRAAGNSETLIISGLSSSTTYYFAIKTADEVPNWSPLSNVASGTTVVETQPPAALANLGASNETEHSIRLTWTAPGDDGTLGTASEYDVRYSTSPITTANFDAATQATGEAAPNAAGSFESFTVTGLESGTTYYFAVKTADEVPNWSAISNVVSRETAPDQTPPSPVLDLQAALDDFNLNTLFGSNLSVSGQISPGTKTSYSMLPDHNKTGVLPA